jgi:hypothetical protein
MRSRHAVGQAGYGPANVVNVTWTSLPGVTDSRVARTVEQNVMEGLKDSGIKLVNRKDPEIGLPFGGYF